MISRKHRVVREIGVLVPAVVKLSRLPTVPSLGGTSAWRTRPRAELVEKARTGAPALQGEHDLHLPLVFALVKIRRLAWRLVEGVARAGRKHDRVARATETHARIQTRHDHVT